MNNNYQTSTNLPLKKTDVKLLPDRLEETISAQTLSRQHLSLSFWRNDPVKILIVDSELTTCYLLTSYFGRKNYLLRFAENARKAYQIFQDFNPDLVILDVNLKDGLGFFLCQKIQKRSNVFILILTSLYSLSDKKRAFEQGADDYLIKPFDICELECRIKAILKRSRKVKKIKFESLTFGNVILDPNQKKITIDGELSVSCLTNKEFVLLFLLASQPGKAWKRREILDHIWKDNVVDTKTIDVHVGRIRQKLKKNLANSLSIETIRGVGYKITEHFG